MCSPNMPGGKTIDVVAGILWRGTQYLAVQRPAGKALAGWWEFPGGKVERGEDRAAALIRELAEELDIAATEPHFWQSVHHGYASTAAHGESAASAPVASQAGGPTQTGARQVHVHFYHVHAFTGEPRPCEGQTLRWVSPAEAVHLPFLAADVSIVERLRALASGAEG